LERSCTNTSFVDLPKRPKVKAFEKTARFVVADKKFLVSQAKPDKETMGVSVDGKFMPFSKSGRSFYVSDPAMAKDIDQSVGVKGSKEVIISEVPQVKNRNGHNYFFSIKKPECTTDGCKRLPAKDNGRCEEHQKEKK
jgi:hypothetical protein